MTEITEAEAQAIAASARRIKDALYSAGFPTECTLMTARAMPEIVRVICSSSYRPAVSGADDEDGGLVLASAGGDQDAEGPGPSPCAATQAYGATCCT